jgi:excisionase family DNA binding protein
MAHSVKTDAMTDFMAERPLTIEQAAVFLSMKKSYLYKKIALGEISHYKPHGGKVYFRLEDLKAYCFSRRVCASHELRDIADAMLNARKGE